MSSFFRFTCRSMVASRAHLYSPCLARTRLRKTTLPSTLRVFHHLVPLREQGGVEKPHEESKAVEEQKAKFAEKVPQKMEAIKSEEGGQTEMSKTAEEIKEKAEHMTEEAKDRMPEMKDQVKEQAANIAEKAKEKWQEKVPQAKEKMEEWKEKIPKAQEKAQEKIEEIKEKLPEAKEKLSEAAGEMKHRVDETMEVAEGVKNTAGIVKEKVKAKVKEKAPRVVATAKRTVEKIKDKIRESDANNLGPGAMPPEREASLENAHMMCEETDHQVEIESEVESSERQPHDVDHKTFDAKTAVEQVEEAIVKKVPQGKELARKAAHEAKKLAKQGAQKWQKVIKPKLQKGTVIVADALKNKAEQGLMKTTRKQRAEAPAEQKVEGGKEMNAGRTEWLQARDELRTKVKETMDAMEDAMEFALTPETKRYLRALERKALTYNTALVQYEVAVDMQFEVNEPEQEPSAQKPEKKEEKKGKERQAQQQQHKGKEKKKDEGKKKGKKEEVSRSAPESDQPQLDPENAENIDVEGRTFVDDLSKSKKLKGKLDAGAPASIIRDESAKKT